MDETKESRVAIMDKLAVDDSVIFDVPRSSSISKAVAVLQRRTGKRFTRKKVDGGIRVTRIVAPGEAAGFAAEAPLVPEPPYEAAAETPSEDLPCPPQDYPAEEYS
jgi:hypothetical protein